TAHPAPIAPTDSNPKPPTPQSPPPPGSRTAAAPRNAPRRRPSRARATAAREAPRAAAFPHPSPHAATETGSAAPIRRTPYRSASHEHPSDRSRYAVIALDLLLQPPPPRSRDPVVPSAPVLCRLPPFRCHPALQQQALQRGIERTLLHLQHILGVEPDG